MIRRTHRSLPWLGAVAALLLLALPVQADEIEPEPYFEEETEPASESNRILQKMIDVAIIRPLYFVRLVTGLPFFVFYPLTLAASDWSEEVVGVLWTDPYEATFLRPLGEPPGDY